MALIIALVLPFLNRHAQAVTLNLAMTSGYSDQMLLKAASKVQALDPTLWPGCCEF